MIWCLVFLFLLASRWEPESRERLLQGLRLAAGDSQVGVPLCGAHRSCLHQWPQALLEGEKK